ncbi:MAG: bifunctional alpha,alpha-trehalose-phosphate synthase (UDP-forming)/trehalose-phosphatase, partial [Desulfitobacteriaceae bacterium]|nr:bifunctional alpha,alpha-trehalose-phosphate synthase (UDP-forming)/trehalose-phosphatase [Desulfitobacteriaceae bacterium]
MMNRIIFISNRLPVTVKKGATGFEYHESIGGLATGLKNYHQQSGSIWIGWSGLADDEIAPEDKNPIRQQLKDQHKCLPVFLSQQEIDEYYYGFCNNTIWPLFHYFTSKTQNQSSTWKAYQAVNQKFFKVLETIIEEDDIIWIHDYQLMLLPRLIKEKYPQTQVGFFLHIPFPSFEIFRLLVWRKEILLGLLGADLIGFHTYDYVRHFLSSVRRLLGLEHNFNKINYEGRYILVDAFPMGIDYDFFVQDYAVQPGAELPLLDEQMDSKIVLSVDRLDYTKGIPERIKAFSHFLEKYPEYHEKIKFYLIVAPSREEVDSYIDLLKEIEELTSKINGKYGTVKWMPIWFFFRSFSQEDLVYFYRHADVMLVTPLRDGMNLVAKEYIASRTDYEGMLVISETAGAASELSEALIVNVQDLDAIAANIKTALEMPEDEKRARNQLMHKRLKRYNVKFWAREFLTTLKEDVANSNQNIATRNLEKNSQIIERAYQNSQKRVLFLDYDGTLVGFKSLPEQAKPDEKLIKLLSDLALDPKNTVVIVSGRDKYILEEWFGDLNIHILASHGLWLRHPLEKEWTMTTPLGNNWKDAVRSIMTLYTDRTPGSFIEEKDYSMAWHYRQCEPDMVAVKLSEIRENLMALTRSTTLGIQEGNKVLEV